jgi:thymidylate synthase (FAD)
MPDEQHSSPTHWDSVGDSRPKGAECPGESPTRDELQWKKFPVLSDGFVCLVDVMGDDAAITNAAKVSYGNDLRDGVSDSDGVNRLLRYMMRHRHTSPFEMAELKFLVRVPMDCWRQWIRHRTANVSEYSTRYSEAIDTADRTSPGDWRLQSTSNKQGSMGTLEEWPPGWDCVEYGTRWVVTCTDPNDPAIQRTVIYRHELVRDFGTGQMTPGLLMSWLERQTQDVFSRQYRTRLAFGIAREQARKDLPLSTYTEAYWKIDLHNLLHFLALRMDTHAQLEIRQYATTIGEQIVKPLFPLVWQAFMDYRVDAMTLSRLERKVLTHLTALAAIHGKILPLPIVDFMTVQHPTWANLERCRERDECLTKLQLLGIVAKAAPELELD